MKSKPQWQAYVLGGKTREARKQRLDEVPAEWRDTVRRHVETWFAIRKFHSRKKIKK